MVIALEKKYTVNEYLALEKKTNARYEYIYGKLIPMSGEFKNANRIANFFVRLLSDILEEKKLEIFTHEVKLLVEEGKLYRYPDVVIAPDSDEAYTHAITQPVIIMEILSASTESVDRKEKLFQYRQIDTLQHYLIVSQDEKNIEMYSRHGKKWLYEVFNSDNPAVQIPALNTSIPIDDIYKKVKINFD